MLTFFEALSQPLQERIHRDCYEAIGCRGLPMFTHPEGRCSTPNSEPHKETCLLHW